MDKKTLEAVLEELIAGMCKYCEHDCDGCWEKCGDRGWEKETFIKWLKKQIKEAE